MYQFFHNLLTLIFIFVAQTRAPLNAHISGQRRQSSKPNRGFWSQKRSIFLMDQYGPFTSYIHFPGFFLDISKKTQARKNSKLKQNPEKTQEKIRKNSKTGNSSWVEIAQHWMKTSFLGKNLRLPLKTPFLLQNVFKNEKLLALFWNILKNSWKKLKTQAKSRENSSQNSKKLKNRQLQLSWVGGKLSKQAWLCECIYDNFRTK